MDIETYNSTRLIKSLEKFRKKAAEYNSKIVDIELDFCRPVGGKSVSHFKIVYDCGHSEIANRYQMPDRTTKGCVECRSIKTCCICNRQFKANIKYPSSFQKNICSYSCRKIYNRKKTNEYYFRNYHLMLEKNRLKQNAYRQRKPLNEEQRERKRELQRIWYRRKKLAVNRANSIQVFIEGVSQKEAAIINLKQKIQEAGNKIELLKKLDSKPVGPLGYKSQHFLIRCQCGHEEDVNWNMMRTRIKNGCTKCMSKRKCVECGQEFELPILTGSQKSRTTCSKECWRQHVLALQKKSRIKNSQAISAKQRERRSWLYHNDPVFKQKKLDAERIRKARKRAEQRLASILPIKELK